MKKVFPIFRSCSIMRIILITPLIFYVFDILELDGKNMEELPLTDRKKILKKIVGKNTVIRYCDHVENKGISFFEEAREKRTGRNHRPRKKKVSIQEDTGARNG
jgi:bifunctional non-homologous end joining protein LigD